MSVPKSISVDIRSMKEMAREMGLEVRTGVADRFNQSVHHFRDGDDVVMFTTNPVRTGIIVSYSQKPKPFEGGYAFMAQSIQPDNGMYRGEKNPKIQKWLIAVTERFAPPVPCDPPTYESELVILPIPNWVTPPRHWSPKQDGDLAPSARQIPRSEAKKELEKFFRQAMELIEKKSTS